jgi:hypothetical protein
LGRFAYGRDGKPRHRQIVSARNRIDEMVKGALLNPVISKKTEDR